jgi:putative polyhydroxyalkanoate system protein
MSEISIRRTHGMSLKRARSAAEQIAAELSDEFSIDYEWDGNTLHFHRSGVTGTMIVDKKTIEILAKLSFLLRPLKSRIEREIHRFCDENFGPESA